MGGIVFFIFYGSILFFVVAMALRVRKCIAAPLHLHWELYKGSSIYETPEWWVKTQSPFSRKFFCMVADVLFLREYYHRNRSYWYFLYSFHLGLYIIILWHAWLFISPIITDVRLSSVCLWICHFATAVGFFGGLGILVKRMTDKEMSRYYAPIHYVKWAFVLLTLAGGFYAVWFHFKGSPSVLMKYVADQVAFSDLKLKLHPAPAPALHVVFASLWLIYLPFSHFFQLFFRYYHHLRWDDVPNKRGSQIEKRVKELLNRPVTWSGLHIPTGKRWKEVASDITLTSGTGTK